MLAQLARRSMRAKITVLEEAFTGHFTDHHAFLLGMMLGRVDAISADIAALDERIAAQAAPLADAVARLDEIPGISLASAYVILAEIGTDMTRFPTAGHLASWAGWPPASRSPPGRRKARAPPATATPTWPPCSATPPPAPPGPTPSSGEKYRRIARRRGSKRAIVAVGRSILVIAWHLLSDPDARFQRPRSRLLREPHRSQRRKQSHIRQLEALGYTVTLQPTA